MNNDILTETPSFSYFHDPLFTPAWYSFTSTRTGDHISILGGEYNACIWYDTEANRYMVKFSSEQDYLNFILRWSE